MTRVKRGTTSVKTRKNILRMTKGYRFGRSSKERQANEAIFHAGSYAFAHRRDKKGDFRRLWNARINAATRNFNISYGKFIGMLKNKKVELDRKILSEIANDNPETFKRIVENAK
ncbi:MAG: 50S ribosomal protein L20 [Patescibacteria group bacterium]|nr:50S ribosomal protein L20 [Patescibacteria group bacterium]